MHLPEGTGRSHHAGNTQRHSGDITPDVNFVEVIHVDRGRNNKGLFAGVGLKQADIRAFGVFAIVAKANAWVRCTI